MTSPVQSPVTDTRQKKKFLNAAKQILRDRVTSAHAHTHKKKFGFTYNPHVCCEHQGHTDGEANEVECNKITQSTNQLFPHTSKNTCSHALQVSNTGHVDVSHAL